MLIKSKLYESNLFFYKFEPGSKYYKYMLSKGGFIIRDNIEYTLMTEKNVKLLEKLGLGSLISSYFSGDSAIVSYFYAVNECCSEIISLNPKVRTTNEQHKIFLKNTKKNICRREFSKDRSHVWYYIRHK